MISFIWLTLLALGLAFVGFLALLWAIRSGQYDDLQGEALRILDDEEEEGEIHGK